MKQNEGKRSADDLIERLNAMLATVDFAKLDRSCNSKDNSYSKEILKRTHDICVEIYGTNFFDNTTVMNLYQHPHKHRMANNGMDEMDDVTNSIMEMRKLQGYQSINYEKSQLFD